MIKALILSAALLPDLWLFGVIWSSEPGQSVAVIGHEGRSRPHRIGDHVAGWRIEAITSSTVTLSHGHTVRSVRVGEGVSRGSDHVRITTGIERSGNSVTISQSLRDFLIGEGLVTVMMQAASEAVFDASGVILGFRISEIDRGSIYDLAGLQDGDLVTHINGEFLSSPARALALMISAKYAEKVQIGLNRQGKAEVVSVVVK